MIKKEFITIVNAHSERNKAIHKAEQYHKKVNFIRTAKANVIGALAVTVAMTTAAWLSNPSEVQAAEENAGILTIKDTTQNVWEYGYTYEISEIPEYSESELYVRTGFIVDIEGDCEDWEYGDQVHLIMSDNGTDDITDDKIIKVEPTPIGVECYIY